MLGMWNVKLSPEGDGGGGGEGQPTPSTNGTSFDHEDDTPGVRKRIKQLLDRVNALEAEKKSVEDARKTQEEGKLLEQKKFETLANQYKTELEQERLNRLRLEVASKVGGLPIEITRRLQGADEKELLADAEAMKAYLKPSTPGVPPGPSRTEVVSFSPEQMRDPEWVLKHEKEILAAAQAARQ